MGLSNDERGWVMTCLSGVGKSIHVIDAHMEYVQCFMNES